MGEHKYVIAYDVGTTGVKTCLFQIGGKLELVKSAYAGYSLYILEGGKAEQDPDEWWAAIAKTTKAVLEQAQIANDQISAISFCSQMQCLVLVDKNGVPVCRAMSYLDNRAAAQHKKGITQGIKISGLNARKTITSLLTLKAVSASVKDPVWKYQWVRENEPERFSRVHKWLDAKDYLICRFTGEFTMTKGSAYSTFMYDTREGREGWSKTLCRMFEVDMAHLPKIINASDIAGHVSAKAAEQTGLAEGTPVYGGGGDAELIGVGIGAVEPGETHAYIGTSGWISTVTEKQMVDISTMTAATMGVQQGRYHYFSEMETAGKCLEWVKDHLALDEIDVYLEKKHVLETLEQKYLSLYDYLCEVIERVPAGSNSVVFAPWLHGNRCPFEDANARGVFFNISIDTGKSELIRAVIEGIAFHLRLMIEAQERKLSLPDKIMAAGGGAISDVICQILADVFGREICTINGAQNAGAYGAAILMAASMGQIPSVAHAKSLLPEYKTFKPNKSNKVAYDRNYSVFCSLYKNNKESFKALNQI
ncbi:FGGY-family carbohydrate kinase [Eubacteriales bacterium OttesenSCG-928-K08]|nr:FGGY-family carbohydrate kinase [Eubacteriales bacterium OttesenSCG-928-K08]